jgi:hypothetical protein
VSVLELHDAHRESLAVFEALRRLGFPSDDIFQHGAWVEPDKLLVQVVLRPGADEFRISVGLIPKRGYKKLKRQFRQAMVEISSGRARGEDLDRIWQESDVGSHSEKFLMLACALEARGIACPARVDQN